MSFVYWRIVGSFQQPITMLLKRGGVFAASGVRKLEQSTIKFTHLLECHIYNWQINQFVHRMTIQGLHKKMLRRNVKQNQLAHINKQTFKMVVASICDCIYVHHQSRKHLHYSLWWKSVKLTYNEILHDLLTICIQTIFEPRLKQYVMSNVVVKTPNLKLVIGRARWTGLLDRME